LSKIWVFSAVGVKVRTNARCPGAVEVPRGLGSNGAAAARRTGKRTFVESSQEQIQNGRSRAGQTQSQSKGGECWKKYEATDVAISVCFQMQKAEMEELRQREANLTALQAIGPRKKPKLDLNGASSSSGQVRQTFLPCIYLNFL